MKENNNPIFELVLKVLQIVGLSLLWLVCCLPVFTAGASTAAAYYTAVKLLRNDRGYLFSGFFSAFRKNFKQATVVTLLYLAVSFFLYYEMSICDLLAEKYSFLPYFKVVFIIIAAVVTLYYILVLFLIARFQNRLSAIMKNALLLSVRHMGATLLVGAIFAAGGAGIWLLPILALLVPGVCFWLCSIPMEKVYQLYMTDSDRKMEDLRNLKAGHE